MNILVTGGTGFLGEALIPRLKGNIRVVARNEGKLIELKQKFPDIEIITGDVADELIARTALKDIDVVYHLAAFKHVGLAEKQTYQCINSNLVGSANILKHFTGEMFVAISTDKAAQIAGVYGATKFLMEKMIEECAALNTKTKYRVVRYGNVLYSTGSVLCKWKKLMEEGKEVTVTDPSATRFFWTREQAIDHIFECIDKAPDEKPYIPKMKAISIGRLLDAMMEKYGKVNIKKIGLQPGENLHETMDGTTFSDQVPEYSIEEIMELI